MYAEWGYGDWGIWGYDEKITEKASGCRVATSILRHEKAHKKTADRESAGHKANLKVRTAGVRTYITAL